MNTLILYYSYTGNCQTFAEDLAQKNNADIEEVQMENRPGTVWAYVFGSFAAMRHRYAKIKPLQKDLQSYDKIILVAPIWASNPAPAFNTMLRYVPTDKELELYFVSGSGHSAKEKITAYVEGKGFTVSDYQDVKQSSMK